MYSHSCQQNCAFFSANISKNKKLYANRANCTAYKKCAIPDPTLIYNLPPKNPYIQ